MKNGFTLIELSITIVVIGLLTGGLLVANNLINTARINGLIQQIQQSDIAVRNFKTKYDSIPGDTRLFSPSGNGDGIINEYTESPPYMAESQAWTAPGGNPKGGYDSLFFGEISTFYSHLVQSGIQFEDLRTPDTNASSGIRTGVHIPESKMGKSGIVVFNTYIFSGTHLVKENAYLVGDFSSTTDRSFKNVLGKLSVTNSLAFDSKFDDGVANSGDVRSHFATNSVPLSYFSCSFINGDNCVIIIKMPNN